jgi:hypothetical protein
MKDPYSYYLLSISPVDETSLSSDVLLDKYYFKGNNREVTKQKPDRHFSRQTIGLPTRGTYTMARQRRSRVHEHNFSAPTQTAVDPIDRARRLGERHAKQGFQMLGVIEPKHQAIYLEAWAAAAQGVA